MGRAYRVAVTARRCTLADTGHPPADRLAVSIVLQTLAAFFANPDPTIANSRRETYARVCETIACDRERGVVR